MSLYLGDKLIAGAGTPTLDTRNVGQIIQSAMPLSDAGLHLLDGSLLANGSYSAFIAYMASMYVSCPEIFDTESNWQQSVAEYGVCGKFVYDSVNNTVRLPKKSSTGRHLVKSTVNGTSWCDVYSDGWCEQGGRFQSNDNTNTTVTFLKAYKDTNYTPIVGQMLGSAGDATYWNWAIYSMTNSTMVIHNATNGNTNSCVWQTCGYIDASDLEQETVYPYIVIANSTKTEIEVDIDEIATDLNGKADTDLANITNDGKQAIINSLMPDYENVISVDGVARGTYTQVVKDSFVITWGADPYTENYYVYVSPDNGTTEYIVGRRYDDENGQTEEVSFSFFVPKGWSFTNNVENGYHARIYPLKGAQ